MLGKTRQDWMNELPQIRETLREFGECMHRRPFDNWDGLRGGSAFALYYFVKKIRPDVVFEVGVWKGLSTWIIEQAAPDARVYCFDPIFFLDSFLDHKRVGPMYRSPRATYMKSEFACTDIGELTTGARKPLAFFDDHQPKMFRLVQAKNAGIRDVIVDDNFPQRGGTHRTFAHDMESADGRAKLEQELDRYEVFPALWDIDWTFGGERIQEQGLFGPAAPSPGQKLLDRASRLCRRAGIPIPDGHLSIFRDRQWYSYVTYVHVAA